MRISDWSSDVCSSDRVVYRLRSRQTRVDGVEGAWLINLSRSHEGYRSRHGASTAATCGNDEEVLRTAIDCDRIADALARDPRVAVISGCLDVDRKSTRLTSSH